MLKSLKEKVLFVKGRHLPFMECNLEKIDFSENPDTKTEVEYMKDKLLQKGWKRQEIRLYNLIRTNLLNLKIS